MGIIAYSVGYCKLTRAVGYRNKTVHKLGLLTRNIAICLTLSLLSSLACEYAASLLVLEDKALVYWLFPCMFGMLTYVAMQSILFDFSLSLSLSLTVHPLPPYAFVIQTDTVVAPFADTNPSEMVVFGMLIADFGAYHGSSTCVFARNIYSLLIV